MFDTRHAYTRHISMLLHLLLDVSGSLQPRSRLQALINVVRNTGATGVRPDFIEF